MCLENKKLHLLCTCLNHTSFALISNFSQPRHYEHSQVKSCIFLGLKSSIQPFYFLNTFDLLEFAGIPSYKNSNFSKLQNSANMNKVRYLKMFSSLSYFNVIFVLCPLGSKLTSLLVLCLSTSR